MTVVKQFFTEKVVFRYINSEFVYAHNSQLAIIDMEVTAIVLLGHLGGWREYYLMVLVRL